MTARARFSIIPIGSLHTGWALKVDGIIRRSGPSLIPLGAYVDAIMAGADEANAANIARAIEARPWPTYEEQHCRRRYAAPCGMKCDATSPTEVGLFGSLVKVCLALILLWAAPGSSFAQTDSAKVATTTTRWKDGSMLGRAAATISIALGMSVPSIPLHAETLTLCRQKIDYQLTAGDPAVPGSRELLGVWVGDILAFNVSKGTDFRVCIAYAIEQVTADGKVVAKTVSGDWVIAPNGNKYSVKPRTTTSSGTLIDNNKMLRFASDDGKTVVELRLSQTKRMEGHATFDTGYGRIILDRQ